ncbi:uncharacterized protein CDAR_5781 [Caerostris darwini]|uniref:Transposase n=1 Tax=Caerostris darwini TaxID=1538125 RepID=A0AAV4RIG4_9ARAC|nr:uncharacterized protein CDAR_5781 [Caerostris darwini]
MDKSKNVPNATIASSFSNSTKVTLCCGLMAAFIAGPFFFEKIAPSGPLTCTRYESRLCNQLLPTLQQCRCMDRTIFIQDGTPPHIASVVKQLWQ